MVARLVRETMPVIAIRFEVLQQRVSRLSYGRDNGAGRRELKELIFSGHGRVESSSHFELNRGGVKRDEALGQVS